MWPVYLSKMNEFNKTDRKCAVPEMNTDKPKPIHVMIWKWISGFGLATSLLVILGIQTWLATLEMVDLGLFATLKKYFHWSSWYVWPEINGKKVIPMPGGYWVCALLMVNMICGGLIRARKGWKTCGVILAHFSIVFMIAAGGVAQLFEERGVMVLFENERADYAVSLTDPTIEIFEIVDGEPINEVRVVDLSLMNGLSQAGTGRIELPGMPMELELAGWLTNARVMPDLSNRSIDGWALRGKEIEKQAEMNAPGCYARVLVDGEPFAGPIIMAVPPPRSPVSEYPAHVFKVDGRTFAMRMVKKTIAVPYQVELVDARSEYFPNSSRPKLFESDVLRIEDEAVPVEIKMNEPMRAGGLTFFQRTMGGGPQNQRGPEFSGFEVVSNPADRWPEYSLYMVTLGLLIHFVMKLVMHFRRSTVRTQES